MKKNIGPYRIVETIGHGGMGVVYKAIHEKIEQTVAIKAIPPYYSQDSYIRDKFLNEAKLQAKLSHPNIVNVINYIESEESIFLVMEYVKGETLEQRIKRLGSIPYEEAIDITVKILDALQYLHNRGIIHRDLKPSNIMFTEDDIVKVTDFGISKLIGQKGLTTTILAGSYTYISPEEITGQGTTFYSDIYSFGITLYHMLAGRVPFDYDTEYRVMKAHLEEKPKDLRKFNRLIPFRLSMVVLKAISKEPEKRYKTPEEFKLKLADSVSSKKRNPDFALFSDIARNIYSGLKTPDSRIVPGIVIFLLIISALFISFGNNERSRDGLSGNFTAVTPGNNLLDEIVLMDISNDQNKVQDSDPKSELAGKRKVVNLNKSKENSSENNSAWKIRK